MADFEDVVCGNCGVHFGLEPDRVKELRRSHRKFYCPNGDFISYEPKSDAEKETDALKVEVKELREKLTAAQTEIEMQTKKANELSMELEIYGISSTDDIHVKHDEKATA